MPSRPSSPRSASRTLPLKRFAQIVTNLTVRSNKSGVINGEFDTGNIEFWPSNYGTGNDRGIPGASGSTYDFGDGGFSGSAGHGSFQVHNYLNAQTVFGINRWGDNRTSSVSLGIGTPASTETLNSSDKDWTFAENAAAYASRRLYVLARPEEPVPVETLDPPAEVIAHVLEQVPDVTDYRHLYTVDIPRQPKFADAAVSHYYWWTTPPVLRTRPIRVASWNWSNTSPASAGQLSTPFASASTGSSPANDDFFQQTVSNLDVFSNVNGWSTPTAATPATSSPGTGTISRPTPQPSRCVQQHLDSDRRALRGGGTVRCKSTITAPGRPAGRSAVRQLRGNDSVCVGIGNNPSGSPDWTHSNPVPTGFAPPAGLHQARTAGTGYPRRGARQRARCGCVQTLYTIDIPVRASMSTLPTRSILVDNAATLNGAFGRGSFQVHNYRLGQTPCGEQLGQ